jgi:hypothetical protein
MHTTRIQTDWRYPQQRSWHRNVRQIYFSGLVSYTLKKLEQHPCYCCWSEWCNCSKRVQALTDLALATDLEAFINTFSFHVIIQVNK